MTSKDELREAIRQCFKRTHMQTEGDTELFDTEVTIDQILNLLEGEKQKLAKAYGGCTKCYGKGYATTIDYTTGFPDFIGDSGFKLQNEIMRYCTCDRGKQLATLNKGEAKNNE